MRYYREIVFIGVGLFIGMLNLYADEAKGYKIILSSFQTLEEANSSMQMLGSRIGSDEAALQKENGYEIVARASGKAFIIAIEPFSSQEGAEKVKNAFLKYYPGSYINGYFGPTEGAIVLNPTNEAPGDSMESTQNEEIQADTLSSVSVEENVTSPDNTNSSFPWLWSVLGGVIITIGIFWYIRLRTSSQKKGSKKNEERSVDEKDLAEGYDAVNTVSQINVNSVSPHISKPLDTQTILQKDIFYKLQKNVFFKTLLDELKKAAQSKNEQRCKEIMEEIFRYQKNFRQSEKITSLQQCIESKEFDKLVELIGIS